MRRTNAIIQMDLNSNLMTHKQKYTITEYTATYIRFSNGIIFNGDTFKRYRIIYVKGGKPQYFPYHDTIICSDTPIKLMNDIVVLETKAASTRGGVTCQIKHGAKIKNNLNTGTPWNRGCDDLPPSWNAGLTKQTSDSMKRISLSKCGANNPCYGKIYSVEERTHLSTIMKNKILNGTFTPAVRNQQTHWTAEWNGNKYRSTWERNFHMKYPWLEYEKIRIQYAINGKSHIYITDFVDPIKKIIYEIKPSTYIDDDIVIAKSNAAIEWCNINGYTFIIVTELTESCLTNENKKHT